VVLQALAVVVLQALAVVLQALAVGAVVPRQWQLRML